MTCQLRFCNLNSPCLRISTQKHLRTVGVVLGFHNQPHCRIQKPHDTWHTLPPSFTSRHWNLNEIGQQDVEVVSNAQYGKRLRLSSCTSLATNDFFDPYFDDEISEENWADSAMSASSPATNDLRLKPHWVNVNGEWSQSKYQWTFLNFLRHYLKTTRETTLIN